MLLIPTDTPGISMQPIEHSNLRYTASMDVYFDDVCVSQAAIVGGPDMWNEAWHYAQQRIQFGKPIAEHQAIRHKLVTAKTKLQAARHMLYHSAWLANEGLPCSVETSMAKLFGADVGVEIAIACQQVMGAYAPSDAYDMERNVRDLLSMPIVGGSSDMQRNNLASMLKL